jgi:dTDP-4-dehydrorhamnose reductase
MATKGQRRAVVLGARGTLGAAICQELERLGWSTLACGHAECDISDGAAVSALIESAAPAVVFNAAAFTDVDGAESQPDRAYAVNATGAGNVARAAAAAGAVVVHYSTDFVFDGELERPYHEDDAPSPQGVYARSKADGDGLVAAATPRHFILRVGCLYGRGGRNFPSTIVRRLWAGETVRADSERLGSPTWVKEVAHVSGRLATTELYGLYHCTSQGATSWSDFALHAARLLGVPEDRVQGVASASLRLKAPRPRRAVLDNRRLRDRGLDMISTWQDALAAFVAGEPWLA